MLLVRFAAFLEMQLRLRYYPYRLMLKGVAIHRPISERNEATFASLFLLMGVYHMTANIQGRKGQVGVEAHDQQCKMSGGLNHMTSSKLRKRAYPGDKALVSKFCPLLVTHVWDNLGHGPSTTSDIRNKENSLYLVVPALSRPLYLKAFVFITQV